MNDFNQSAGMQSRGEAMDMSIDTGLRSFMLGVYNKMALGLVLTAAIAYFVGSNDALVSVLLVPPLAYVVMFAPLVILVLSSFIMKNPSPTAANLVYWSVVALIGVGMGAIVYTYARMPDGMLVVARAFFTTAAAFGALSLWGYTTKKDLSGWGTFLIMGVVGLIVAMVINMFVQSSFMGQIIPVIGVLLFAGLTAYDTQTLKRTYYHLQGNARAMSVATTYGALHLYLNFVNMFQFILAMMSSD
jgi:FtsH-binding integral membrane protein